MISEINQTNNRKYSINLYVKSEKYDKLVNITKKRNRLTDVENRPVVTSREGRQYRGRGWEV